MNKKPFLLGLITILLSVGLSIVSVYAFVPKPAISPMAENMSNSRSSERQSTTISNVELPNFIEAAEKSVNAVVNVTSEIKVKTSYYDDYYSLLHALFNNNRPNTRTMVAYGSGVIISEDGYIVTNNHVVQNADKIEITLNDRRKYIAKIIGVDPSTDLALLKIEEKNLDYLIFGNSDDVRIGEWVLAVGNPFNLTSTVTAGIVSAKARNINILSNKMANERPIESFIQTDAAVNSGNSGGALVNTSGHLIGINTAIASNNGTFTGYSFAIPANIARKVTEDLRNFGQVQRAYLGITFAPMNAEVAEYTHNKSTRGLYISRVLQNSAADKAGLKAEDIILQINRKTVNTEAELLEVLGQNRPGDAIFIQYERSGKPYETEAVLQNSEGQTTLKPVKPWTN